MKQFLTQDGEPLFQFLPVDNGQDSITLKRHCPFIGLDHDVETVMTFPTLRNCCHRLRPSKRVRTDYQRTHCLTFAHRHCPVLLKPSIRTLPAGIAVASERRRPVFLMLGVASVFMLLAFALLLFGAWQWTSANNWLFDSGNVQNLQEMIGAPGVLQVNPGQLAPTMLPANYPPSSESLPVENPVSGQTPEPTPTPLPSTEK